MSDKKFQKRKKVREKDIYDFAYDNLKPKEARELMNCIYDYYTLFEDQLQAKTDECEEFRESLKCAGHNYKVATDRLDTAYDNAKKIIEPLRKENTALKQQLDISVEVYKNSLDEIGSLFTVYGIRPTATNCQMLADTLKRAKTALEKLNK